MSGVFKSKEGGCHSLEGSVERVTFHSEESGFCVLKVKLRGNRNLVTIVGKIPNVVPGELIVARGDWIVDKKHGRQFSAVEIKSQPPNSIEGIKKFLGSGFICGIGKVYAGKMVDTFGKDIFEIIDKQSARLEQIDGIGSLRRKQIKDGWNESKEVRAIMTFLLSHGVSTARAFRIYKVYGDKAIKTVRDDPYCLARDIRGVGFKTADQVAMNLGVEREGDLRARAGVEHVLLEVTGEGHCAFQRTALVERAVEILDISEPIIERAIDYGVERRRLVEEPVADGNGKLVFLANLYHAENGLVRHLKILSSSPHPCPPIDVEKAVVWCEEKTRLKFDETQRAALEQAFTNKTMVVTGGPGVGKTTLINSIIKVFVAKKLELVLCAPTGRAAKRMSETSRMRAKTVHRLLEYDPGNGRFRHDAGNPLDGDVFIVDESSMMDLPLAYSLISAIPAHAALILVGDVDQLPSVGPGSVLRDIIDSGVITVCRLRHVFRQAARSHIITNAHRINEGEMPYTGEPSKCSDFYFIDVEDPDEAVDIIVKMVKERIPLKFKFSPIDDIQVITPMRRGTLGSQNLNQRLQAALNPRGAEVTRFGYTYRVGDKVMQIVNNYDKDVFNGDIGRVTSLSTEDREITVCFDRRAKVYDLNEIDELVPSYAITIHKSQGSEYPCVVIPVHTQHFIMLERNLLYTAVTRGKRLVVLVGTRKATAIAVRKVGTHHRITTLRDRLMRAMQADSAV